MLKKEPDTNLTYRQHIIDTCVKYFIKVYPSILEENQEYKQMLKETSVNEFAADKENDIRLVATIPRELDSIAKGVLKQLDQTGSVFLKDKEEVEWFFKRYKQFVVPDKI